MNLSRLAFAALVMLSALSLRPAVDALSQLPSSDLNQPLQDTPGQKYCVPGLPCNSNA